MLKDDSIAGLEAVNRVYDGGRVAALIDVHMYVQRHEALTIIGPSGSGKSTLLHLLSGLDRPSAGRVLFEGCQPCSAREWARIRAAHLGFVFQSFHLLPTLTAAENVEIPMFGMISDAGDRRKRSEALLSRVGLSARASHRPGELSGGERQRVSIARALANSPDLILADEPTGNLDSRTSMQIIELLLDIHRRDGTTLIVVTHDRDLPDYLGRRVEIKDGRIIQEEDKVFSCGSRK